MLRFVLLTFTEGADKPLKYPTILNGADVAIITEYDILAAVEFNESAAIRNVQSVRPGMQICHRKPARGMPEYLQFLENRRSSARIATTA